MKQQNVTVCHNALDYISGACSDTEKKAFERHLPGCPACQSELEELRLVWDSLPSDMELIEPPADLKQQVMDAALASVQPHPAKRSFRKLTWGAAAAAVLAVLVAGTAWNVELYRSRSGPAVIPIEQALSVSASQINQLISLKPVSDDVASSYAVACIVDNGSNMQFVVYVFGAPASKDSSVYQVWLNHAGQKDSAGTFRVDDKGIGVLAMPISGDTLAFDSIGITLEPDEHGNQPRGTRLYSSIS
ncbi:anti-sigma factor [Paenibacillus sp. JDR-2]|uniref:anti-sigma factor n=1 Tax=Paenibacillus sp. (strain JDR-2) TaxID=324057 RepID=UPI0001668D03|nr:anti-sigma factor [Paenibacillus sp. JDR-2]ACT02462.1 putative transmembrane anti-sigma factor [Paenibacillus sp. JDR-2]